MKHTLRVLAAIFALALFATACGTSADVALTTEDGGGGEPAAPAMESNDLDGGDERDAVDPVPETDPVETPVEDPEPTEAPEAPEAPEVVSDPEPAPEPEPAPTEEPEVDDVPVDSGDALGVLNQSAGATRQANAYRTEMFMEMNVVEGGQAITMGSAERPLASGEIEGSASSMVMDLGVMFEPMMADLSATEQAQFRQLFGGDDLTMTMISLDSAMYLRSPFLAAIAGQAGGLVPELAALDGIGEKYGLIDLAAAGGDLDISDISSLGGIQGATSFDAYFDMIESAGDVEVVGNVSIRGVETTQYLVAARLGDLLGAQGMSPDQLGLSAEEIAIMDILMDFEVFLDDDGMIRRFTFSFDDESMGALAGEELPADAAFSLKTTMDFFDFDDASISVQAPPADQVLGDITDAFLALQEMG